MTTLHLDHNFPTRAVRVAHAYRALQSVANTFYVWADRAKKRRELRGLLASQDHVLKDIGLHRHDISREALKPFWRA